MYSHATQSVNKLKNKVDSPTKNLDFDFGVLKLACVFVEQAL